MCAHALSPALLPSREALLARVATAHRATSEAARTDDRF
jgi:hypothetical protein